MLLIVFSKNEFKLFYKRNMEIADSVTIDNIVFSMNEYAKKSEGFIGFFDWLRLDDSTIVGIRISYFEDLPFTKFLSSFSYVKKTFENKSLELLFRGNNFDFNLSGDQDFTNNYVYKSQNDDYLCTFGLDHLTEGELNSLVQCCTLLN